MSINISLYRNANRNNQLNGYYPLGNAPSLSPLNFNAGTQGTNKGESIGTGPEYFVSTAGSDSNDGSAGSPFSTLVHAIAQLTAGGTVTVKNGIYTDPITPAFATQSGTPGQPITIRAENYGGVIIAPTASVPAIDFYSSATEQVSHWTVDGFICRSNGETRTISVNSVDNVALAAMTNNIVVKRCGAFGSAIDTNTTVVSVARSQDCLVEDVFAYGNGRKAMQFFGNSRLTVRRPVGRYDYWRGDSYKPNDPRNCMSCYNNIDSLIENPLMFDSGDEPAGVSSTRDGIIVSGNDTAVSVISGSQNIYMVGAISINNIGNGISNSGGTGDPTRNVVIQDFVSWGNTGNGTNVSLNSDGTQLINGTVGNNGGSGFRYSGSTNANVINQVLRNGLSLNNGVYGIYNLDQQMAVEQDNTLVGNSAGGDLDAANNPTLTNIFDPQYVNGNVRGATITHQTVDGVLTNTPLFPWPYEDIIKTHMLDDADLATCQRTEAGVGVPGWKAADNIAPTSLSEYILGVTP
jgi:hypothetical protein